MATTTVAGTSVTFSNSTAAANLGTIIDENASSYAYAFDVLAASGGGKNTTLYSVDNGTAGDNNAAITTNNGFTGYDTDLLYKDVATADWQPGGDTSALGAHVWIGADGKIHYDASNIGATVNALSEGEHLTDTFKYTIKMANGTLSVGTLTIDLVGRNDAVMITSGAQGGSVTEDVDNSANENNESHMQGGFITYTDADNHDTHTANWTEDGSNTSHLGTFTLDTTSIDTGNGGTVGWNFSVDDSALDSLQGGEHLVQKYNVTVDDGHGGQKTETVTIDIYGTNDAATFGGADTGSVTEDGTLAANGMLTTADVDHDESGFQAVASSTLHGTYGNFTFDETNGSWTYTLRNGDANVQALNAGDNPTDTLTVHSLDGTAHDIVVTVHGADEPPPPPAVDSDTTNDHDLLDVNGNALVTSMTSSPGQPHQFNGTSGADIIVATNDPLNGDTVNAQAGDDIVYGRAGNDTIQGMNGHDTIYGGSGNDKITGGGGPDDLWGGSGNDIFIYTATSDSAPPPPAGSGFDTIHDFHHGFDKIDVSLIDANSNSAGTQHFTFNGLTATANGIWFTESATETILHFDVNGNTANDEMTIHLTGIGLGLTAADFILV